jgi:hypothetical protein
VIFLNRLFRCSPHHQVSFYVRYGYTPSIKSLLVNNIHTLITMDPARREIPNGAFVQELRRSFNMQQKRLAESWAFKSE